MELDEPTETVEVKYFESCLLSGIHFIIKQHYSKYMPYKQISKTVIINSIKQINKLSSPESCNIVLVCCGCLS